MEHFKGVAMDSKFILDSKNEGIIALWLDKYFYSRVRYDEKLKFRFSSRRADDFNKDESKIQRSGIDIVYKNQLDDLYFVDEKAQLDYLNNNLRTFAFEIKFRKKNSNFTSGWFVREDLETTHYLLVYPNSSHVSNADELTDFEEISQVELLLLNKETLWSRLYQLNIFRKNIEIEADEMIIDGKNNKKEIASSSTRNAYLYRTSYHKKKEEPVNIVIRREILDDIAEAIWVVTKEYINEKKAYKYYY